MLTRANRKVLDIIFISFIEIFETSMNGEKGLFKQPPLVNKVF